HGRYFMDKLVDHLFILDGSGGIRDFNGFYSEYRAQLQLEEEESRLARAAVAPAAAASAGQSGSSAGRADEPDRETRKLLKRLENKLAKLEEEKQKLLAAFNEGSLEGDALNEASARLGQLQEEIDEAEAEWMELA